MRVGKEGVIGAIVGIERWLADDRGAAARDLEALLRRAEARLDGVTAVARSR